MSIIVYCPHCQKKNSAPDAGAGKRGKCMGCGELIAIPLRSETDLDIQPEPMAPPAVTPAQKPTAASLKPKSNQPYCTNCGSQLPPNGKFCSGCGEPVSGKRPPVMATKEPQNRQRESSESQRNDDVLEGYWYAIIWGSLVIPFIGVWIIVILSSVMYYAWKTKFPAKAKKINLHGWLAWLSGNLLWLFLFFGLSALFQNAAVSVFQSDVAANQAAAVASCKVYAEAQEIYRRADCDSDGILEYAQHLKGNASLLENTAGSGDLMLIDRAFADAEGDPSRHPTPKAGYCFKILKAQGAQATGGQRSYVINGNMTLGYALVAYPATYGSTGRYTYLISNNGTIFGEDLGLATPKTVEAMTEFNPDPTWDAVE